jgi:hypothetical protein
MTANYGFTTGADYAFTYDEPRVNEKKINDNSLLYLLNRNIDYSKFLSIVNKAGLEEYIDHPMATLTLFACKNNYIRLTDNALLNMDRYTARKIVTYSILDKIKKRHLLCNGNHLVTKHPASKILSQTDNGVLRLNRNIEVLDNGTMAENGILYSIKGLLIPEI